MWPGWSLLVLSWLWVMYSNSVSVMVKTHRQLDWIWNHLENCGGIPVVCLWGQFYRRLILAWKIQPKCEPLYPMSWVNGKNKQLWGGGLKKPAQCKNCLFSLTVVLQEGEDCPHRRPPLVVLPHNSPYLGSRRSKTRSSRSSLAMSSIGGQPGLCEPS